MQIRDLREDIISFETVDKQTLDLLVVLERTKLIDETSVSCVSGLDPAFIMDTVMTLESIFRRYEVQIHEKLEMKFDEFSKSQLYMEMMCVHRLDYSELVRELISFQLVLRNVVKTGVLTWTGGFGSTLIHYGPYLRVKEGLSQANAEYPSCIAKTSTATAMSLTYDADPVFLRGGGEDFKMVKDLLQIDINDQEDISDENDDFLTLEEVVDLTSPVLLARILTLLLSNSSLTLLSTSTKVSKSLIKTLKKLIEPFKLFHRAFYSPSSSSTSSAVSSLGYTVVDSSNGCEVSLHMVEDLLVDFEDKKQAAIREAAGQSVVSSSVSSAKVSLNAYSDFKNFEASSTTPAASRFLEPTSLLTCLYTPHYSGRGPLIDHTFVIDIDRCQILSNPIGQEAILLTLEPCYLHNLATRLKTEACLKVPVGVSNTGSGNNFNAEMSKDEIITSSFKYFLIECILRFIPAHLAHFPDENVIGFDVENFFRDIDVDDVKQLYRKGDQHLSVQPSSPNRTVPRSKSFYYSFVDSPYFFYLLIQHGIACSLDHRKLLSLKGEQVSSTSQNEDVELSK